jgi:hypothetical protein
VARLLNRTDALVAVWVTNSQRFQSFVKTELFRRWNVEYCTTWYWVKV